MRKPRCGDNQQLDIVIVRIRVKRNWLKIGNGLQSAGKDRLLVSTID